VSVSVSPAATEASTGSAVFLDALLEAGVKYVFANLGSDHTGLMESLAAAKAMGKPAPSLITCPTEMVALSAAQGYAQVSGAAQAVVVHVECGTQSLAGALHNAAKGRVPIIIFAGASPFTQNGESVASRNEFIHWIQDVHDQRGLVRGYVKYDYEFRSPDSIREITFRALRFAYSEPRGPVYVMAAREVMEGRASNRTGRQPLCWRGLSSAALPEDAVARIASDLARARRPLIVTSYIGRNPPAFDALVALCNRLAIGVLESVPSCANFPHDHALYLGNQWNDTRRNPALAAADVILVIDSDVPWIPSLDELREDVVIHHLDVDPLKVQMPLAVVAARQSCQVDAECALRQIYKGLDMIDVPSELIEERRARYESLHRQRRERLHSSEVAVGETITPEFLTARVRDRLDAEAIVLSEGISNYQVIADHLGIRHPHSYFTSGGGSLGWSGGAAIGAKLAAPAATVVALTGDGSYMMSHPCSVHWIARRYKTPFLQIIYNNGGWKSPRLSTLAVHPDGYASRSRDIGVSLEEAPDHAAIAAAAGGAFARIVQRPADVEPAIDAALRAVREEHRAAVLDVRLASF
jgi:acetolactate synthase I/II/III large subunit